MARQKKINWFDPKDIKWLRKIAECAEHYRPANTSVIQKLPTDKTIGQATAQGISHYVITCPPLLTRWALAVYLHECGHIVHGHMTLQAGDLSHYEQELEAENYALEAMRHWGIPVPKTYLALMRAQLKRYKLKDDNYA